MALDRGSNLAAPKRTNQAEMEMRDQRVRLRGQSRRITRTEVENRESHVRRADRTITHDLGFLGLRPNRDEDLKPRVRVAPPRSIRAGAPRSASVSSSDHTERVRTPRATKLARARSSS